jgi:hypothetical protein
LKALKFIIYGIIIIHGKNNLHPLKLITVLGLCEVRGPVGLFAKVAVQHVSVLAPAGAAGRIGRGIP